MKKKKIFEKNTGLNFEEFQKGHEWLSDMRKGNNSSNVSISSLFDKEDPFGRKKKISFNNIILLILSVFWYNYNIYYLFIKIL